MSNLRKLKRGLFGGEERTKKSIIRKWEKFSDGLCEEDSDEICVCGSRMQRWADENDCRDCPDLWECISNGDVGLMG